MKRFLRFRLRTFLTFIALIGCVGSWYVMHDMEYRREAKLIEKLVGDCKVPSVRVTVDQDDILKHYYDNKFFG